MKKTLVVVDMQNDFIDGALGTKEAVAIVPALQKKIEQYKENGGQIIFTSDTHGDVYMDTQEGKNLTVPHCIKDTEGWQIRNVLDAESNADRIIDKDRFGYPGWNEYKAEDLGDIEIIGLCTDICVVSNAILLKALFPENKISVDAACFAGVTPEAHEAALTTMASCQIEVIR